MKSCLLVCFAFLVISCGGPKTADRDPAVSASSVPVEGGAPAVAISNANAAASKTAETVTGPRTVREFFELLPPKYFTLEGCEPSTDANCVKARSEYVKTFLEVEDAKNGYWKSGCDGGQSCLEMAIFKRPDGNYIVLVKTESEMNEDSWFLEYSNGKWTDIGSRIVPEFSAKNTYVPPRLGTSVEVYAKKFPEPDFSERGKRIYNLEWKDGKFSIKR